MKNPVQFLRLQASGARNARGSGGSGALTDAFSLIEVVIAIGICSVCFVALIGLIPIGLSTNQQSIQQTAAANLASAVAADLRATTTGTNASAFYGVTFPAPPATTGTSFFLNGDGSVNTRSIPSMPPMFRVTVGIYQAPATSDRAASSASILITWPALADSDLSKPPTNWTGSFQTVIGLDRN